MKFKSYTFKGEDEVVEWIEDQKNRTGDSYNKILQEAFEEFVQSRLNTSPGEKEELSEGSPAASRLPDPKNLHIKLPLLKKSLWDEHIKLR